MTSADMQQTLDIQIQDDLKYDIRLENSYVERYKPPPILSIIHILNCAVFRCLQRNQSC